MFSGYLVEQKTEEEDVGRLSVSYCEDSLLLDAQKVDTKEEGFLRFIVTQHLNHG